VTPGDFERLGVGPGRVEGRNAEGRPAPRRALIDLHLHTTASDGRCTPAELVALAGASGVTAMAVTDHDTTAGIDEAAARAAHAGLEFVSGIEITAVEDGADVHVLGYFVKTDEPDLQRFLVEQRASRVARVVAIADRLAALGRPIDIAPLVDGARHHPATAIGRPQVARAMAAAGHVTSAQEAFDDWLARGRPAFVPRSGLSPESVIRVIHASGGLASLAHPGRTRIDHRIPALRAAGLDALEVFHSDHGEDDVARYAAMAASLGCLRTGGSDYHGDPARGVTPGCALPRDDWDRLLDFHARHV
jgi:predicted metal-dependent phosphoesterase TrpH